MKKKDYYWMRWHFSFGLSAWGEFDRKRFNRILKEIREKCLPSQEGE